MFKRIFVIVFDSLGIGRGKDADKFHDVGSDTMKSVLDSGDASELGALSSIGFLNLCSDKKYQNKDYKEWVYVVGTTINQKASEHLNYINHKLGKLEDLEE